MEVMPTVVNCLENSKVMKNGLAGSTPATSVYFVIVAQWQRRLPQK